MKPIKNHLMNGRDPAFAGGRPSAGVRGRLARCVTRLAGHFGKLFGGGAEKGRARRPRSPARSTKTSHSRFMRLGKEA
jgi:hypothetical protein